MKLHIEAPEFEGSHPFPFFRQYDPKTGKFFKNCEFPFELDMRGDQEVCLSPIGFRSATILIKIINGIVTVADTGRTEKTQLQPGENLLFQGFILLLTEK